MRRISVTLLLSLIAAQGSAEPPRGGPLVTLETLLAARAEAAESGADALLRAVTQPLVGRPYVLSPLGEGEGIDPDPRLRLDAFDCVTFVETALALAAAPSVAEVLPTLDALRYAGRVSYASRNHFVEAQWIPENLRHGWIRPISQEIAGPRTLVVEKEFAARPGGRSKAGGLRLAPEEAPEGRFSLPVVPLELALGEPRRFPAGSLLFVVREVTPGRATMVSHTGLVLEVDGVRVLRHAAREPFVRVVDEPLDHFFKRNRRYSPRVLGVAVYEVMLPPRWTANPH